MVAIAEIISNCMGDYTDKKCKRHIDVITCLEGLFIALPAITIIVTAIRIDTSGYDIGNIILLITITIFAIVAVALIIAWLTMTIWFNASDRRSELRRGVYKLKRQRQYYRNLSCGIARSIAKPITAEQIAKLPAGVYIYEPSTNRLVPKRQPSQNTQITP